MNIRQNVLKLGFALFASCLNFAIPVIASDETVKKTEASSDAKPKVRAKPTIKVLSNSPVPIAISLSELGIHKPPMPIMPKVVSPTHQSNLMTIAVDATL